MLTLHFLLAVLFSLRTLSAVSNTAKVDIIKKYGISPKSVFRGIEQFQDDAADCPGAMAAVDKINDVMDEQRDLKTEIAKSLKQVGSGCEKKLFEDAMEFLLRTMHVICYEFETTKNFSLNVAEMLKKHSRKRRQMEENEEEYDIGHNEEVFQIDQPEIIDDEVIPQNDRSPIVRNMRGSQPAPTTSKTELCNMLSNYIAINCTKITDSELDLLREKIYNAGAEMTYSCSRFRKAGNNVNLAILEINLKSIFTKLGQLRIFHYRKHLQDVMNAIRHLYQEGEQSPVFESRKTDWSLERSPTFPSRNSGSRFSDPEPSPRFPSRERNAENVRRTPLFPSRLRHSDSDEESEPSPRFPEARRPKPSASHSPRFPSSSWSRHRSEEDEDEERPHASPRFPSSHRTDSSPASSPHFPPTSWHELDYDNNDDYYHYRPRTSPAPRRNCSYGDDWEQSPWRPPCADLSIHRQQPVDPSLTTPLPPCSRTRENQLNLPPCPHISLSIIQSQPQYKTSLNTISADQLSDANEENSNSKTNTSCRSQEKKPCKKEPSPAAMPAYQQSPNNEYARNQQYQGATTANQQQYANSQQAAYYSQLPLDNGPVQMNPIQYVMVPQQSFGYQTSQHLQQPFVASQQYPQNSQYQVQQVYSQPPQQVHSYPVPPPPFQTPMTMPAQTYQTTPQPSLQMYQVTPPPVPASNNQQSLPQYPQPVASNQIQTGVPLQHYQYSPSQNTQYQSTPTQIHIPLQAVQQQQYSVPTAPQPLSPTQPPPSTYFQQIYPPRVPEQPQQPANYHPQAHYAPPSAPTYAAASNPTQTHWQRRKRVADDA